MVMNLWLKLPVNGCRVMNLMVKSLYRQSILVIKDVGVKDFRFALGWALINARTVLRLNASKK